MFLVPELRLQSNIESNPFIEKTYIFVRNNLKGPIITLTLIMTIIEVESFNESDFFECFKTVGVKILRGCLGYCLGFYKSRIREEGRGGEGE